MAPRRPRTSRAWSIPPTAFVDRVAQEVADRQRRITIAMLGQIVLRAPVDTGRFLANNIVSVGAPVFYSVDAYDKTGGETIAKGETVVSGLRPYTVTYIQNNLIYAGPLEDGHSRQAPAGIYGIAFHEVAQAYNE